MATASVKLSLDNAEFMARMAASQARLAEFGATMRGLVLSAAGAIGAVAGVYGATQALGKAINEAANMEKLEVSFTTLIGNTKAAKALLADLASFADSTPFELNDLAPASKKLLAYGFAAKDIIPTLSMLGDIASGLDVPLGELVDVFGKNIAQGRLFQEDINQFQSRGIPIVEALAKTMGQNESAIRGMVTEGKIGSAELMKAFQSLTGPGSRFGGMMAEQSKTFGGMMSTIADRVNALFREFGAPLIAALKPVLAWVDQNIASWKEKAVEWGQKLADAITIAFQLFKDGKIGEALGLSLQVGMSYGWDAFIRYGQAAINAVAVALGALGAGLFEVTGPFAVLGSAEYWLAIGTLAASALIYAANQFSRTLDKATGGWLSDMSDRVQEDLMEIAELTTPGATVRTDAERLADVKRMRESGYAKNDTENRANMSAASDSLARLNSELIKGVKDVGPMIADGFKDALAKSEGDPDARKNGDAAMAKLTKLLDDARDAGRKAVDAMKPAEKTGEVSLGKPFATPADAAAKAQAAIADSLAKVGGGGRFVAGGPVDPLVALANKQLSETQRQTKALETIADAAKRDPSGPRPLFRR